MDVRAICWDWNGTLLDDVDVCQQVMNRVLTAFGRPVITDREAYRATFRFPIRDFYLDVGLGDDVYLDASARYLRWLDERVVESSLHVGAAAVLSAIAERGVRQVLASSTAADPLRRQMQPHGLDDAFEDVLSIGDPLHPSKRDVIARWSTRSGLPAAAVLMVGDTNHDREIADELGMQFLHFDGGHQHPSADVPTIRVLDELLEYV